MANGPPKRLVSRALTLIANEPFCFSRVLTLIANELFVQSSANANC